MEYISKYLSNEIREKLKLVIAPMSPDKSFRKEIMHLCILFCQKRRKKAIKKSAQIHSYRIEHPELQVPFSVPRNSRRKFIREGVENISNSFEWGCRNFNPKKLDEEFIKELIYRINPEIYRQGRADYRKLGTHITGASVTPPDPYKVRVIEMPNFINQIKNSLDENNHNVINKIKTAVYSHLHLARIHPFEDGNGRTARIFQDIILDYYNLPLPVIESGERDTYYHLLDRAVYDWKHEKHSGELKHGATKGEHDFYTFIVGKVNVSLDHLIDCVS